MCIGLIETTSAKPCEPAEAANPRNLQDSIRSAASEQSREPDSGVKEECHLLLGLDILYPGRVDLQLAIQTAPRRTEDVGTGPVCPVTEQAKRSAERTRPLMMPSQDIIKTYLRI